MIFLARSSTSRPPYFIFESKIAFDLVSGAGDNGGDDVDETDEVVDDGSSSSDEDFGS